MVDRAHKWTDKQIKRLAERIRYHYRKSASELKKKAQKHLDSYERNRVKMAAMLSNGEITPDEFAQWKSKWAVIAARDQKMIADLTESAQHATAEARSMISSEAPSVFAECANWSAYEIDRAIGRRIGFDILDKDTVLYMMHRDPKVLPISQKTMLRGATAKWHSQKLTSALTQGILQGESVKDVAKRIAGISAIDSRAAEKAARTALTCAENKGRQHSYERAAELGVEGEKEWLATLDDRTRDSHREMDGVRVKVDEKFPNGLEEPGDPDGEPEEVWNCRCTMTLVVPEVAEQQLERWDRLPADVSYDEWKARGL